MLSLESAATMLRRIESQSAGAIFIGDLAQLPNILAGDTAACSPLRRKTPDTMLR